MKPNKPALINPKHKINRNIHYFLFSVAIILILVPRVIPYIHNSIPIGYDAGIYKYGIEQFKAHGFGIADWLKGAMSPLFFYLTFLLSLLLSTNTILIWLFIASCVLLGFAIYLTSKSYFNKETALISLLVYSVSLIQFKVFEFLYYKNILALSLMLFSLYFLKPEKCSQHFWGDQEPTQTHTRFLTREKRIWFIIFASLTGAMHLPTFYIFGLAYFVYAFVSPIKLSHAGISSSTNPSHSLTNNNPVLSATNYDFKLMRNNVVNGCLILILTLILYLGFIQTSILPLIKPVASSFINPGEAPGTFLSFFQYQFSTLDYLPFAILGFFTLIKRKQFSLIFFLTLITAIIVYFQFFFFNRFIIHLDIMLIILAGLGFSVLIQHKKKFGVLILAILLFSSFYMTLNESRNAKPLINESQLELIQKLQNTESNSLVMSISSQYSPYVLAYSGRPTIAPGIFEENKWNLSQWNTFWATNSTEETKQLMSVYDTTAPIYLFAGSKTFNNPCFTLFLEQDSNKIYKYNC